MVALACTTRSLNRQRSRHALTPEFHDCLHGTGVMTVMLGTVMLGTVMLGTVMLGTVMLGTVMLGTCARERHTKSIMIRRVYCRDMGLMRAAIAIRL